MLRLILQFFSHINTERENNDDNNNNTADNNNRQNGIPKTVLKACQNSKLLPKFQSYHLNFLDIFIIINVN